MPEQLNCSIEYDDSWEQIDCHWKVNRFFRLTWDKADGYYLYYRLGDYIDGLKNYKSIDTSKVYTTQSSYIYELPFSAFSYEELAAARDTDGWITLTVYNGSKYKTFTKFYLLELPPVQAESADPEKIITAEPVTSRPGEIKVYWSADYFIELDGSSEENSPDSLDGYCIEVFRCPQELDPANAENFTKLDGLQWEDADPETGMPTTAVYKLIRIPVNVEVTAPEVSGDPVISYTNLNPGREAYIETPLLTEFYFEPEKLGINRGDFYKFRIYPYSHYEGALLSSEEIESGYGQVPKAIVRVKTATGWAEGLVYVMVDDGTGQGVWREADSIYVKTADGWKETT